jgi:hypothetical protein
MASIWALIRVQNEDENVFDFCFLANGRMTSRSIFAYDLKCSSVLYLPDQTLTEFLETPWFQEMAWSVPQKCVFLCADFTNNNRGMREEMLLVRNWFSVERSSYMAVSPKNIRSFTRYFTTVTPIIFAIRRIIISANACQHEAQF